jgi:abortive infection Abi-like protein
VGGLNTVIQGICELRNKYGFASHGKTADFPSLEPVQSQLVARSADALVHFLMSAHKSYPSQFSKRESSFEDFEEINRRIDEDNEVVKIFTYEYRPSEVLFKADPLVYRDVVTGYSSGEMPKEDEGDTTGKE